MIKYFGIHYGFLFLTPAEIPPPPPPVVITTITTTTLPPTTTTIISPNTLHPGTGSTPETVKRNPDLLLTPLEVAMAEVDQTGEYAEGGYWCAKFASWVLNSAGINIHSNNPVELRLTVPATNDPTPGDLVFITYNSSGHPHHVAFVESVNVDGSVNTIEGNGQSETHVTRGTRFPSEIVSYGDVDQLPRSSAPVPYVPFVDPLCEVKPWLCPDFTM